MQKITCPHCGEEIPANLRICPYCGESLISAPQPTENIEKPADAEKQADIPNATAPVSVSTPSPADSQQAATPQESKDSSKKNKSTFIVIIIAFALIAAAVVIDNSIPRHSTGTKNAQTISEPASNTAATNTPSNSGHSSVTAATNAPSSSGHSSSTAATNAPSSSGHSSSTAATAAPSTSDTDEELTVYCKNEQRELTYYYGYKTYSYGDYIIITGDNGANGMFAGDDVVSYDKSTRTYNYVCFSYDEIVYAPLLICRNRKITEEGDCAADTEWETVYEYYSGTTNSEIRPKVYSGTLGKSNITVEIAFDSKTPKAVGTYYYNRNGSKNRMMVYGDILSDGTLKLQAYDTKFYDKPSETMYLTSDGSGYSGYWEKPNRDQLSVNLYLQ